MACGFLEMLPVQIHKDVGQIPYHLARELGWSCQLVYWMKENHEIVEPGDYGRFVRNVSVSVGHSRRRRLWLFLQYLRRNSKDIDVLLLYHLTSESILYASVYKLLNPRGVAVLKLDMDYRGLSAFDGSGLLSKRGALMRLFQAAPFSFITIETERMYRDLVGHVSDMGHRLHVFPIGIDCSEPVEIEAVLAKKQNIVLTAGRLGVEQKNNQLLLDALDALPPSALGDWEFWFVGSMTPEFKADLGRLRGRRPDLAKRIVVRDFVTSREDLAGIYKRARVYCLTSRWESFAIVLAEAAYYGCYLLSTDVGAASALTQDGRSGQLVRGEDATGLARALAGILSGSTPTEASARDAHRHVKANYDWPAVVRQFADLVQKHQEAV